MTKKILILVSLITLLAIAPKAQNLSQTVDALMSEKYASDGPGAAVLIAKDGEVIYKNAFGLANLELSVPMSPDNVFEIGSITKQFTAVSILMLKEQGKVSLEDDITKYLPDYPTHGHNITVHHLLNHTSGIKSYTSMPGFISNARKDRSPIEVIDFFKDEPMDFDPGERYLYNNSAYIILGYIIEQVSGQDYGSFIEDNIFEPLGMDHSYYGSKSTLIPNRANGYQPTQGGYKNADYLSMTFPYAAGSLMSCVEDLLKWEQAIHNNELISAESKALAFTNGKLNNGDPIYYGYGWAVNEINEVSTIEHGGGIFGYTTYAVYVPSEDVYAVVLSNSNGNDPSDITVEIAAHAIGKPFSDGTIADLSEEEMKKWEGTYEFEDGVIRYVSYKEGKLYSQREGSDNLELTATGSSTYMFSGRQSKYEFKVEDNKRVAIFQTRIRKSKGIESEKKRPAERVTVQLNPATLMQYVGKYELQPGFVIDITVKEDKIYAQATGQPQFELFAEKEDHFFLKVVDAQMVFDQDDSGVVSSMTLYQGGGVMPAKRIN